MVFDLRRKCRIAGRTPAPRVLMLALLAAAAAPRSARAQGFAGPRPKIEAALGVGASFDAVGMTSGVTAVPGFFVMGGFGDGLVGVDLGAFTNSASGRFRDATPVDRLALDAIMVIRPLADRWRADDPYYSSRFGRALALDIGASFERTSHFARAPESVTRFGLRVGAHLDFPLTPPGNSELRVRLAVRRFVGASHVIFPNGDVASDTRGELFAALVSVF